MSELKPCPFCGGEAKSNNSMRGSYYVYCITCNAASDDTNGVDKWNTRKPDGWVSVETPPKEYGEYIIYDGLQSTSGNYNPEEAGTSWEWVFTHDFTKARGVTHWRELPPPPTNQPEEKYWTQEQVAAIREEAEGFINQPEGEEQMMVWRNRDE